MRKTKVTIALILTAIVVALTYYGLGQAPSEKEAAIITLGVLGVAIIFFFTEIIPLAVTSMLIPVVLVVFGTVEAKTAFSGLSNSTVVLFGGMFIVGGALFETGVAKTLGDYVVKASKGNVKIMMIGMMAVTAALSAVLSNTSTVAVLLPVCVGIADAGGFARAKLLMPVAMLASTGGMISLVGTPPNGTANAVIMEAGLEPFGFFEFAWIGIPVTIAAILYMALIGHRLVPDEAGEHEMGLEDIEQVEFEEKPRSKKIMASAIMLITVIVMFTEILPPHVAAIAGAMACIITGCIGEMQAYHAIDWVTIFLFAGTLSLAAAMAETGAGMLIAEQVIDFMGGNTNPYFLMTVLFVVATGLTQFMSNTAAAALLAPIGLSIAQAIGADPKSIILAIAIACSAAYCTPIATPPNTLILGPANLRFIDYVKVGLPLLLITYLLTILIMPRIWPFFPA